MIEKTNIEKSTILFRLLTLGLVLSVGGYTLSECVVGKLDIGCLRGIFQECADQKIQLEGEIDRLEKQQDIFNDRLRALTNIYSNPKSDIAMNISWASIEELQKKIEKIEKKTKKYQSFRDSLKINNDEKVVKNEYKEKKNEEDEVLKCKLLIPLLIYLLFNLFLAHIILRHGISAILTKKDEKINILKIYLISVLLVFLVYLIRTTWTSIFIPEKTAFSSTSYCISPMGWSLKNLSYLGILFFSLYPFSLLMCFSDSRFEKKITFRDPKYDYGVGNYILFLHTWTILSCIGVFLAIIPLTITSQIVTGELKVPYLAEPFVAILLCIIIIKRLVHRAVSIRIQYQNFLNSKSWKEINKMDLPPDPTNSFLGEKWFMLPASLTGVLIGIWVFIKYASLDVFILDFFK